MIYRFQKVSLRLDDQNPPQIIDFKDLVGKGSDPDREDTPNEISYFWQILFFGWNAINLLGKQRTDPEEGALAVAGLQETVLEAPGLEELAKDAPSLEDLASKLALDGFV